MTLPPLPEPHLLIFDAALQSLIDMCATAIRARGAKGDDHE